MISKSQYLTEKKIIKRRGTVFIHNTSDFYLFFALMMAYTSLKPLPIISLVFVMIINE